MMYVLDTNVLSELRKVRLGKADGNVAAWAESVDAADLFVLPSLSENLPKTIMESMACGLPCLGFKVGGIPEMIDHLKNGYVAAYRDSADLARGMGWILLESDYGQLSRLAQQKVLSKYSQQAVSMKYIEVYNQAIAFKNYAI